MNPTNNDTIGSSNNNNNDSGGGVQPSVFRSEFQGSKVNTAFLVIFVPFSWCQTLVGSAGAVSVLVVIFKQRKVSNHNLFIANLALTDLLTLGYWWMFFTLDLTLGYHPVLNSTHCVINGFIIVTLSEVYVASLVFVSLDRYVHVCHFKQYNKIFSRKITYFSVYIIWLFGFFVGAVPMSIYSDSYGYSAKTKTCATVHINKVLLVIFNLVYISVPVLGVGLLNLAIYQFWEKANVSIARDHLKYISTVLAKRSNTLTGKDAESVTDDTQTQNWKAAVQVRRRTINNLFEESSNSQITETQVLSEKKNLDVSANWTPYLPTVGQSYHSVQAGDQKSPSCLYDTNKSHSTLSLPKVDLIVKLDAKPDLNQASSTSKALEQDTAQFTQNTLKSVMVNKATESPPKCLSNGSSYSEQDSFRCIGSSPMALVTSICNSLPKAKGETVVEHSHTNLSTSGNLQRYINRSLTVPKGRYFLSVEKGLHTHKLDSQNKNQSQSNEPVQNTESSTKKKKNIASKGSKKPRRAKSLSSLQPKHKAVEQSPCPTLTPIHPQSLTTLHINTSKEKDQQTYLKKTKNQTVFKMENLFTTPDAANDQIVLTYDTQQSSATGNQGRDISEVKPKNNWKEAAKRLMNKKQTLPTASQTNLKLWRDYKRKREWVNEVTKRNSKAFHQSATIESRKMCMEQLQKREQVVIRSLLTVYTLIMVSFLSYGVLLVVQLSFENAPAEVYILANVLLFVNNACNWVVYGILNPALTIKYREIYGRLWRDLMRRSFYLKCVCTQRQKEGQCRGAIEKSATQTWSEFSQWLQNISFSSFVSKLKIKR